MSIGIKCSVSYVNRDDGLCGEGMVSGCLGPVVR